MAERDTLGNITQLATLAMLAVGGYLLYQLFSKATPNLNQAGQGAGGWLFNLFHPNPTGAGSAPPPAIGPVPYPPGSVTTPGVVYYTTTFDNGATHAVDASTVAQDGSFQYQGGNYQLVVGAGGNFAISA